MIKNFAFVKNMAWRHANEIDKVTDTSKMDIELNTLSQIEHLIYTLMVWMFYEFLKTNRAKETVNKNLEQLKRIS